MTLGAVCPMSRQPEGQRPDAIPAWGNLPGPYETSGGRSRGKPQESMHNNDQGPTARPIERHDARETNTCWCGPSALGRQVGQFPGASPQAGMGRAFGAHERHLALTPSAQHPHTAARSRKQGRDRASRSLHATHLSSTCIQFDLSDPAGFSGAAGSDGASKLTAQPNGSVVDTSTALPASVRSMASASSRTLTRSALALSSIRPR